MDNNCISIGIIQEVDRVSLMTALCPNPFTGGISAVRRITSKENLAYVININALHRNPALLGHFNPGYVFALRFWGFAAVAVLLVSVILSFAWHWWAFIPGLIVAKWIDSANLKSAGDFALEAIREHGMDAVNYFQSYNLIWSTDLEKIVRE